MNKEQRIKQYIRIEVEKALKNVYSIASNCDMTDKQRELAEMIGEYIYVTYGREFTLAEIKELHGCVSVST